jgi:hypothetical protein
MKTRSAAELAADEIREQDSAAEHRTRSATFSDKAAEADRELTVLLAERATGGPDNKRADQLREQRADLLDRARGEDAAAEERDRTAKSLRDERTQRAIEEAEETVAVSQSSGHPTCYVRRRSRRSAVFVL